MTDAVLAGTSGRGATLPRASAPTTRTFVRQATGMPAEPCVLLLDNHI